MLTHLLASVILASSSTGPIRVEVRQTPLGYQLLRGGEPTFIKGVGGLNEPAAAARIGVNSARTWGIEKLEQDLDTAQANGMTLMLGIWLAHGHYEGVDYESPAFQAQQMKDIEDMVRRAKNHPALLCYALGNEMEIFTPIEKQAPIYRQVERLAKRIKELDPNHPVTTVTAGISPEKAKLIHELCPSLDFISVNGYEGMGKIGSILRKGGWTRPFMITEFGAEGQWESEMTTWGAPREQNSTAKGLLSAKNYLEGVLDESRQCLGSYAFLWWQREQTVASWFGMQLQTGEKLEQTDQMIKFWSGRPPANRCPQILEIVSEADGKEVVKGALIEVVLYATDPELDPLSYRWELRPENEGLKESEKAQNEARRVEDALLDRTGHRISFRAPTTPGAFKLFGYVRDGKGSAAFATMPFYVKQ
ncbi:MAG: hypothetical protein MUC92_13845 [Fimbriimonadaceae bacterium]|jgi:hypothetical protein|nr:hypothetical protein [Fimbriimonadaceae bacterium]